MLISRSTLYEAGTEGILCDVTVYMPENALEGEPLPGIVFLRGSGKTLSLLYFIQRIMIKVILHFKK